MDSKEFKKDQKESFEEKSISNDSLQQKDTAIPFFIQYDYQQAIELGFLVAVGDIAQQFDFTLPVALTKKVWQNCVAYSQTITDRKVVENHRLINVLGPAAAVYFSIEKIYKPYVIYTLQEQEIKQVELVIYTSPGHAFAKTITIMMADEK